MRKISLALMSAALIAGNLACKKDNPVDSPNWDLSGRIVFQVGSIYILDLNSAAITLTPLVYGDSPRVNPRRTSVVYDAISPKRSTDIYTISLTGGQPTDLTKDTIGSEEGPEWSPDGSSIVFSQTYYRNITKEALCVMGEDGSSLHPLTDTSTMAQAAMPKWSPDGRLIAFLGLAVFRGTGSNVFALYTIRSDGSQLNLVDPIAALILPVWSLDSRRIAFGKSSQSISDTSGGLYVVEVATKQSLKIDFADIRVTPAGFSWLPDGRLVSVGQNKADSSYSVHVVTVSSPVTRVQIATGFKPIPTTISSPTGEFIAIFGQRTGDQSLTGYIVKPDGSQFRLLTETKLQGWINGWHYIQWIN